MTRKEAIKEFIHSNPPFNDYYEMQQTWEWFITGLSKSKQITMKQFNTWDNPCTVENFERFNKKFTPYED